MDGKTNSLTHLLKEGDKIVSENGIFEVKLNNVYNGVKLNSSTTTQFSIFIGSSELGDTTTLATSDKSFLMYYTSIDIFGDFVSLNKYNSQTKTHPYILMRTSTASNRQFTFTETYNQTGTISPITHVLLIKDGVQSNNFKATKWAVRSLCPVYDQGTYHFWYIDFEVENGVYTIHRIYLESGLEFMTNSGQCLLNAHETDYPFYCDFIPSISTIEIF